MHRFIGDLIHNPVYKAKNGHLEAKTRRRRKRLCRFDWQKRVNRMIARNAHDRRIVKPSTSGSRKRFSTNIHRFNLRGRKLQ